MGVGTRLRRQFGEQKVHLLEAIASRPDKIVVRRLDHRAQLAQLAQAVEVGGAGGEVQHARHPPREVLGLCRRHRVGSIADERHPAAVRGARRLAEELEAAATEA